MKRRVLISLIVALFIVAPLSLWGRALYVRICHNRASIHMMVVRAALIRHVEESGQWPRSWTDLFDDPNDERVRRRINAVSVDWGVSLDEILELARTQEDWQTDDPGCFPRPLILRFTNVPRNRNLDLSEFHWNIMLLERIDLLRPADGGDDGDPEG